VLDSLTRVIQTSLWQLRWLAVTAMVMGALISPYLLGTAELRIPLLAYAGVIGILNMGFTLAARIQGGGKEAPFFQAPFFQLSFDLLAWGGYLFLTGGATNPLITIFMPLVAVAALIFGRWQAWFFAGTAILVYSFLWFFYLPLPIADFRMATSLHLLGMWLVFALSAVLVVWLILQLSQGIRRRDLELAAARERAIRDDWLISLGTQAAAAAHELSTPLATLNILADDLLDDGRLVPALTADVQAMKAQIQRCKERLNQLTQRAAQRGARVPAQLPAREWLRHLVLGWQGQHPQAEVTMDLGSDLNDQSLAAEPALESALTNLLDNAVKARARRIEVSAQAQAHILEIRIRDNGAGLPAAALAAFNQGRPVSSTQGLGLGLLLGQAATERLGGSLSFLPRDKGESGTTALLRIPLTLPKEPDHAG